MFADLQANNWSTIVAAVAAAGQWLATSRPGHARLLEMIAELISLSDHSKWEVRRAVALAAASSRSGDFASMLAKLSQDQNAQVRKAAVSASRRRRDRVATSALGEQHEERLNASLRDIEARYGIRGRDAVKRTGEEIADTFSQELHHELARLLTPVVASADRLVEALNTLTGAPRDLVGHATLIKERVGHISDVMRAMRKYASVPNLVFAMADMKGIVDESVGVIREAAPAAPRIEVTIAPGLACEVSRTRLVQALTNLLANAVESYDGQATDAPITVRGEREEERIVIAIADHGCGMSEEVLADSRRLFATSKERGTGFGLPLVVKIVESEHDGRLELDSAKGHGTTARVMLPTRRQRGGK